MLLQLRQGRAHSIKRWANLVLAVKDSIGAGGYDLLHQLIGINHFNRPTQLPRQMCCAAFKSRRFKFGHRR